MDQQNTRPETDRMSEAELRVMLERREAVKEAHRQSLSRKVTLVLAGGFAIAGIAFFAPSANREALSAAIKEVFPDDPQNKSPSPSPASPAPVLPSQTDTNQPQAPVPNAMMSPEDMKFAGELLRFIQPAGGQPKPKDGGK